VPGAEAENVADVELPQRPLDYRFAVASIGERRFDDAVVARATGKDNDVRL
jgi:hypothetical protein